MTSTRRMTGAGLKKCMPTTRPGSAAALAIAVIGIDEVLEASTAPGAISLERGEQLALELQALGRGLDDEAGRGQVGELGRGRDLAAARRSRRPFARQRSSPSAICCSAALARLGHGVVQQRARARRGGELRDPGAHGPGADDADDLGHPAHAREPRLTPGSTCTSPVPACASHACAGRRRRGARRRVVAGVRVDVDRVGRSGTRCRCRRCPSGPRSCAAAGADVDVAGARARDDVSATAPRRARRRCRPAVAAARATPTTRRSPVRDLRSALPPRFSALQIARAGDHPHGGVARHLEDVAHAARVVDRAALVAAVVEVQAPSRARHLDVAAAHDRALLLRASGARRRDRPPTIRTSPVPTSTTIVGAAASDARVRVGALGEAAPMASCRRRRAARGEDDQHDQDGARDPGDVHGSRR